MTRIITCLIALAISAFSIAQSGIPVGATVPDFAVTDTDGELHDLTNITSGGQYVAIYFVFDACAPCENSAPHVNQSFSNYGCNTGDVFFLTVVTGDNTQALGFDAATNMDCPVAGDAGLASTYSLVAYPTLILISPSNTMLINDIWPISSPADIETAFDAEGLSFAPCVVSGCTDPAANNYDPIATVDDGSCEYGCVDITVSITPDCWGSELSWILTDESLTEVANFPAGSYTDNLPDGEGTYTYDFCLDPGCYFFGVSDTFGDGLAGAQYNECNVDGDYSISDGVNTYVQMFAPDFGSNVFHEFCVPYAPVLGCTDPDAVEYNPAANIDDGSCTFPAADMNFTVTDIYGTTYLLSDITAGGQYVLFHFMADWNPWDPPIVEELNMAYSDYGCNQNDVFVIAMNNSTDGDTSSLQWVAENGYLPPVVSEDGGSEEVRLAFGVNAFPTLMLVSPENEIVNDGLYGGPDGTEALIVAEFELRSIGLNACGILGCTDDTACNYDPSATVDDGNCDYSCEGCTNPWAINYDPVAVIDDGSCVLIDCVLGELVDWTEFPMGVYAPASTAEYGVVMSQDIIMSVTDTYIDPDTQNSFDVVNFNLELVSGQPDMLGYSVNGVADGTATALVGEQICVNLNGLPIQSGIFDVEVSGTLTIDVLGNLIDVAASFIHVLTITPPDGDILGCTYQGATNYNIIATLEDGSCIFEGCTNIAAINYSPVATVDDGSCLFVETLCDIGTIWDAELGMCVTVDSCEGDFNGDGLVNTADLLQMLIAFGTACE